MHTVYLLLPDDSKVSQLDRLHKAMKERLVIAPYPENIQILTLASDAWSRKYCAEYFMSQSIL